MGVIFPLPMVVWKQFSRSLQLTKSVRRLGARYCLENSPESSDPVEVFLSLSIFAIGKISSPTDLDFSTSFRRENGCGPPALLSCSFPRILESLRSCVCF